MINLIPNQEKKMKVKDFYFRLVVVLFVVLGFSMLIGLAAILPAYFISNVKKNLNTERLESQKNESVPEIDQNSLAIINDLNSKINLVESAEKNKYLISVKVINAIILKKMSDIKITQLTYENTGMEGKKISIRGIAPSRERLLSFRRALEDDVAFSTVDLPISNFVKGTDIEFYLKLTPS